MTHTLKCVSVLDSRGHICHAVYNSPHDDVLIKVFDDEGFWLTYTGQARQLGAWCDQHNLRCLTQSIEVKIPNPFK